MKHKSILILIIIGVLSFLFLDLQQVVTYIYEYVTQDKNIIASKEGSPIVQGKPCIIPGGTAYYYPSPHQSGYIVVIIEKVNESPPQSLIEIDTIRTIRPFKYHNVRYYPGERLWLPSESLLCHKINE